MRVLDGLLDYSVVFSFDRTGFVRHQRRFVDGDLEVDLADRRCVVTGANSGLGLAAARGLAERGAEVVLACRHAGRGEAALESLRRDTGNTRLRLELVDMSSLASVRSFVSRLKGRALDVLIHNAGVLPRQRQLTADGLELTWATNVVGPFLATRLLQPQLTAAAQGRVIFVSSGGMYPQRLDLSDPAWDQRRFDGVKAYASTKRALVVLTELFAARLSASRVTVNSMHPGWADTPAVRSSLPRFHRITRAILRTAEQGADTILWLALCERLAQTSGRFWFDREAQATHKLPRTRERPGDRERLWSLLEQQAQLEPT